MKFSWERRLPADPSPEHNSEPEHDHSKPVVMVSRRFRLLFASPHVMLKPWEFPWRRCIMDAPATTPVSPIQRLWTRIQHAFLWIVYWFSEEFD
ncbi:hypothetical protein KQI84_14215 [bacterium]|nr:hypothetical protein [bacterium]